MPARRPMIAVVAAAATLCVSLGAAVVPQAGAVTVQHDPAAVPDAAADVAAVEAAEETLADVREIFDEEAPAAPGEPAAEATLELRDLAMSLDDLDGEDRAEAERYLARPTDGPGGANQDRSYTVREAPPVCYAAICVHYVTTTADAPPLADASGNGVPDYVDTVLDVTVKARLTYLRAGYRAPKSDGTRGGGGAGRTDVYIADIGNNRLYGYCPSEDEIRARGPSDASAYCVVDDDYAEFPSNTQLENLQVTIAHEYFHVVQYAYDALEDSWFLEGTATWAEDELYDAVDDNRQYLDSSPLRMPRKPLDTFDFNGGFHYGTWIFFRYLSERYPAAQGGLPTIVRDMFRRADGARGGPDMYSMQAVRTTLAARRTTLARTLAVFAAANRRPADTYSEGTSGSYRPAPLERAARMRRGDTRSGSVRLDHLSSATVRFTPAAAVRGRLRISLQLAPAKRGSAAVISIWRRSGGVRTVPVRIRATGVGTAAAPFSASDVRAVELTLVNAGQRYNCFVSGPYACMGFSRDDRVLERYRATVVRG